MALDGTSNGGGVAPASGPGGPRLTRQGYLVLGMVALAALVFAVIVWMNGGRKPELHEDTGSYGPNLAFERPPEPRPKPVYHSLPLPAVVAAPPMFHQAETETTALDAPLTSYKSNNAWGASQGGGAARLASANQDGRADDELSQRLRSSNLGATARAHVMRHPNLTIPAGTVMPCILHTAINSQLVGFVDCTMPEEVRGATGAVVLLATGCGF